MTDNGDAIRTQGMICDEKKSRAFGVKMEISPRGLRGIADVDPILL